MNRGLAEALEMLARWHRERDGLMKSDGFLDKARVATLEGLIGKVEQAIVYGGLT